MRQRREDDFRVLWRISQEINSSLELNKVLNSSMDQVIRLMSAERGLIMLIEDGEPTFVAGRNLDRETVEGGKDYSRSVVERVISEKKPILTLDALTDQRFNIQASVITMGLRSVLCVPLQVKGRVIGVIYVDNRAKSGIFNQQDQEILAAFANNVAVSIENARLYESLQQSMEEKLRLQEEIHREATKAAVLREKNRMREELAHYLVHDLRNPLTAIIGSLSLIEENATRNLDEEERQLYRDAQSFAQTLLDMVNAILDVYRLEGGHLRPKIAECNVSEIVREVLQAHQTLVSPDVALRADLPPGDLLAQADPNLLRRTIGNLVNNASRFTHRGFIEVRARTVGDRLRVEVADTGPGIPKEYHQKIFDKFGQVEASKTGARASTGLGLTFCKLVVEAHGGRIWVESVPGEGSCFIFEQPLHPPQA